MPPPPLDLYLSHQTWRSQTPAHKRAELDLAAGQSPKLMWIGCADSRVDPCTILNLGLGEVFVHRNVANQVHRHDPSLMTAIYFARTVLNINHFVICGHSHCGGIEAALRAGPLPEPMTEWIGHLRQLTTANSALSAAALGQANIRRGIQTLNAFLYEHNLANPEVLVEGALFDLTTLELLRVATE